jgi:hypothetical protein
MKLLSNISPVPLWCNHESPVVGVSMAWMIGYPCHVSKSKIAQDDRSVLKNKL